MCAHILSKDVDIGSYLQQDILQFMNDGLSMIPSQLIVKTHICI